MSVLAKIEACWRC